MRESRKRKKKTVLKTHNAHEYDFELAWGTWDLVFLAICPFLQSLLGFLMQCNSVAQFRYIVCLGHCILSKKEFFRLSCCTKNQNMVCSFVFAYRHCCLPQWLQARREMVKSFYLAFRYALEIKGSNCMQWLISRADQNITRQVFWRVPCHTCSQSSENVRSRFIQQNCELRVSDELR